MPEEFIPTRGSLMKNDVAKNLDVVVHTSRRPKMKQKEEVDTAAKISNEISTNEINMKKARYEIIKFGMTGFNKQRKEEAKIQLAIDLGAKPRRKQYKNYKDVLKEKKKEKKREEAKQRKLQQMGQKHLRKSTTKKFDKNVRKEKGILDIYGTVKKK